MNFKFNRNTSNTNSISPSNELNRIAAKNKIKAIEALTVSIP